MKRESLKLNTKTFNSILEMRERLAQKSNLNRYDYDERLLKEYIKPPLLENHNLESAYFKATLINSFYSTRMGAETLFKVVKKIEIYKDKINDILFSRHVVQEQLNSLNPFTEIKVERGEDSYGPYSFLTKYLAIHDRLLCYHHSQHKQEYSRLPIYDQLVSRCIVNLENKKQLEATHNNLRNYQNLYRIISQIAQMMNYGDNLTSVDNVFWAIGKYLWGNNKAKSIKEFNEEAMAGKIIKNMEESLSL